jgi:polyphosphate kinase
MVAPLGLQEAILGLIAREAEHAKAGRPARIVAKLNSLVDHDVIVALYAAAQAGVEITLLIRGICCLRPKIPGISDRIRVLAVVDRFLEHTRAFWFVNGGTDEVYISSADWMPRNFHRRVELLVPLLDPEIRRRVIQEILGTMLADNSKTWELNADGRYARVEAGDPPVRSQLRFVELTSRRVKEADATGRVNKRLLQARPLGVHTPEDRPKKKKHRDLSGSRGS